MRNLILIALILLSQCSAKQGVSDSSKQVEKELQGFVFIKISKVYHQSGQFTILSEDKDTILHADNKSIFVNGTEYETIKDEHLYKEYINVESYYPEYGLFILKCYGIANNFYEVEVNDGIGLIRNDPSKDYVEFKDLKKYVMESYPIPTQQNMVRKGPSENTEVLKGFEKWVFVPVEISGDWLKVTDSKDCYKDEVPSPVDIVGWIRWRKNGELILQVGYTC